MAITIQPLTTWEGHSADANPWDWRWGSSSRGEVEVKQGRANRIAAWVCPGRCCTNFHRLGNEPTQCRSTFFYVGSKISPCKEDPKTNGGARDWDWNMGPVSAHIAWVVPLPSRAMYQQMYRLDVVWVLGGSSQDLDTWLITMVSFRPLRIKLWDPFLTWPFYGL